MTPLPPLPKIQDPDLVLDVYTHKSIRFHGSPPSDEYGDTERLAIIGERALELAITLALYNRRPMMSADDIKSTRAELTAATQLKIWMDDYQLRARLRYSPDMADRIDSPEEISQFFHIYLGAVYIRDGMPAIQKWIGQLVNPDSEPESRSMSPPGVNQQQWAPPPLNAPPPLPSDAPPAPAGGGPGMLARFNQQAAQHRLQVQYPAEQTGLSHQPVWTVRCVVNGTERGFGTGKSQKHAKEAAAQMAWQSMGW